MNLTPRGASLARKPVHFRRCTCDKIRSPEQRGGLLAAALIVVPRHQEEIVVEHPVATSGMNPTLDRSLLREPYR
jgi:hypothetical protein